MARALLSSGRTFIIANAEAEYRKRALIGLRNALIGGELELIGIDETTHSLVMIAPDFWIGAEVHPETDAASSAQQSFCDLRVIKVSVEGRSAASPIRGPKNFRSDRIEVITACIDEGLVDFKRHNLNTRHEIYLDWIALNRPGWETRRGFGVKAFEAAESHAKSMRNIS